MSISFHFPWADDLGVGLLSMLSVLTSETAKLFSKIFLPEFAFLLTIALRPCQIIFKVILVGMQRHLVFSLAFV